MTLSTIARPFASYEFGLAQSKGKRTSGVAMGLLYRASGGEVCLITRTPVMAAPAFYYYPTLALAWKAFAAGRQRVAILDRHLTAEPDPD